MFADALAFSNETSTLTCTCDRRDNSLGLSFGVGFSECLSSGRLRECAAVSFMEIDGKSGEEVESPLDAKCPLELTLTVMEISLNDTKLNASDRQALTHRAVKCLRCLTCEKMTRPAVTDHLASRQTENTSLGRREWKQMQVARVS